MRKLTVATCLLIGLTVGWSVSAEAGKNVCRGMSKAQGFHGVQKHDFVNMCQQHIGVVCAALLRCCSDTSNADRAYCCDAYRRNC
jgi:hypothetical protein